MAIFRRHRCRSKVKYKNNVSIYFDKFVSIQCRQIYSFFSTVGFIVKLGQVSTCFCLSGDIVRTRTFPHWKSPKRLTVDFLVITVNILPILRPLRQKKLVLFLRHVSLLLQDFFHIGFVLIFFVSGFFNRAALSTNPLSMLVYRPAVTAKRQNFKHGGCGKAVGKWLWWNRKFVSVLWGTDRKNMRGRRERIRVKWGMKLLVVRKGKTKDTLNFSFVVWKFHLIKIGWKLRLYLFY